MLAMYEFNNPLDALFMRFLEKSENDYILGLKLYFVIKLLMLHLGVYQDYEWDTPL